MDLELQENSQSVDSEDKYTDSESELEEEEDHEEENHMEAERNRVTVDEGQSRSNGSTTNRQNENNRLRITTERLQEFIDWCVQNDNLLKLRKEYDTPEVEAHRREDEDGKWAIFANHLRKNHSTAHLHDNIYAIINEPQNQQF